MFNLVAVALAGGFQINWLVLGGMVAVKILVSCFFQTEYAEDEANKVDDYEYDERIVAQMGFNNRPKSIFDKIDKPIRTVAKSRTGSQSMKWKEFGDHAINRIQWLKTIRFNNRKCYSKTYSHGTTPHPRE